MKKVLSSFIAVMFVVMFTTIAFAGPIDWTFDKLGYTPTSQYEQQKQETARALEAVKIVSAAAATSAATAAFQEKVITYGGGLLLIIGGLAFFQRKDLAHKILNEKKNTVA